MERLDLTSDLSQLSEECWKTLFDLVCRVVAYNNEPLGYVTPVELLEPLEFESKDICWNTKIYNCDIPNNKIVKIIVDKVE